MLIPFLLLLHALLAVALLGAVTHQAAAVLRPGLRGPRAGFVDRYRGVQSRLFVGSVVLLYVGVMVLGALIYPAYRLDARIAFEEMALGWAVGLFELKEHWGGIGLAILPLYAFYWRQGDGPQDRDADKSADRGVRMGRIAVTLLLAFIIWFDFIVGHILNNMRGL